MHMEAIIPILENLLPKVMIEHVHVVSGFHVLMRRMLYRVRVKQTMFV